MCYLFSFCGWILDCIQRAVTFALACIISIIICIGLFLAIVAGIAYGYNYSMAEFLTLKRSDVTVYMRRGQFYDQPELNIGMGDNFGGGSRRMEDNDFFGSNGTSEGGPESGRRRLSDSWVKSLDTQNYAEKLTHYSGPQGEKPDSRDSYDVMPTHTTKPLEPQSSAYTNSWEDRFSDMLVRGSKPNEPGTLQPTNTIVSMRALDKGHLATRIFSPTRVTDRDDEVREVKAWAV